MELLQLSTTKAWCRHQRSIDTNLITLLTTLLHSSQLYDTMIPTAAAHDVLAPARLILHNIGVF
jgi:hypothetical protein